MTDSLWTSSPSIQDLSDEMLLVVVSYLGIGDIINLSTTCQRFDRILQDKTICRKIRIPWNVNVQRGPLLRFLRQPDRAALITHLVLNDLYWIPSYTIRDLTVKLKSLQELHVAGTCLSWSHLSQILSSANLCALSWTWDDGLEALIRPRRDRKPALPFETIWAELLELREKFQHLQFLLIHIPEAFNSTRLIVSSHCALSFLVSLCNNLQQLYIFSWPKTLNERKNSLIYRREEFHPDMEFPKLQRFVLSVLEPPKIHLPLLTAAILHCLQRSETNVDSNSQLQRRNLWVDHPLLDLDFRREQSVGNNTWPSFSLNNTERFCLPLTEAFLKTLQPSYLQSCRHILVTHGCSRIITLNKLLQEAKNLETFCSKAFNQKIDWEDFIRRHSKLTSINVSQVLPNEETLLCYPDACVQMGTLPRLKKLSLPLYCLLEIKSETTVADYFQRLMEHEQIGSGSGISQSPSSVSTHLESQITRKSRIGGVRMASSNQKPISGLDYLTLFCSEVDQLEIGFTRREQGGKLLVTGLGNIGRWKSLTKLTLDGIPVLNGQFIIDIAKGACNIESLRLKDLGSKAKCVYINSLCTALKSWSKLKDFRFEQKYIGTTVPLFQALESCQTLERLFLCSAANDRPLEPTPLVNLVASCSRLNVVYITMGSVTKVACAKLRRQLESLYKASRPALSLVIQNNLEEEVVQYESVHYRDIVSFTSQICTFQSFPNCID